jgi:sugar lactone lactonase YvrE
LLGLAAFGGAWQAYEACAAQGATFGNTSVGEVPDSGMFANYKIVHAATLPVRGSVTKLSLYAIPGINSPSPQALKAVIYSDSGGSPGSLLATGTEVTYRGNVNGSGWFDLPLASPVSLSSGTYWLGFITGTTTEGMGYRYNSAPNSRAYNVNSYTSLPTSTFGTPTKDSEQASIYATYTPAATPTGTPANVGSPAISGTAQQGQTLTEVHGTWTNSPTGFTYQWLQCDPFGNGCLPIAGAIAQTYVPTAEDVGHTLKVQETAINAGGESSPATSNATGTVVPLPPANTSPPSITGTTRQGQTLTAQNGSWANEPTGFAYKWQRCNTSGANCSTISGATAQTYALGAADVGSTLRVAVSAANPWGSSAPATSAQTAVILAASATFGKTTVGASSDTFVSERKRVNRYALPANGSVTKLSIYLAPAGTSGQQVLRGLVYADSSGTPAALLASSEQFTFSSTSAAGWYDLVFSSPIKLTAGNYWIGVMSGATRGVARFRYDSVSGVRDYNANTYASGPTNPFGSFSTDSEQVSLYATYTPQSAPVDGAPPAIGGTARQGQTLTEVHGSWSNGPTSFSYQWLQCDASGNNCRPIAKATGQTYVPASGDVGHTLKVQETASNEDGTGSPAISGATALVSSAPVPANTAPPTISGTAQQGQTLTEVHGTWTNTPTAYAYQWLQCDGSGNNCQPIAKASEQSYVPVSGDVGHALKVQETAINAAGPSVASTSEPTTVVGGSAATQHLEYVLSYGNVYVYDMDQGYQLVKTISLPETTAGIRGVAVAPSTHLMFISYGGDGGAYGNGSVLAYDLVTEKVAWTVHLNTGIDSGSLSPDGKRLYMPTGENTSSGIWNILDTSNGSLIGTIQGGSGAHNTIASADGGYVYLGNRNHNYLDVYETSTGKVREVGPLVSSVRPFTVNGSNTLAFTTATEFDGFQVSSLTTGKPLFTVSFAPFPSGYQFSTASHGVALTPDEKQAYVIDTIDKEVRVYDVSRVAEGVAPTELGVVPVAGLSGTESPCAYDCGRSGWIQASIDGRLMFVGDSGEVIETATRKVLTSIPTLLNTKVSIEVEWANGVPVATSTRSGVGKVG